MSAHARDKLYRQRERLIEAAASAADLDDAVVWGETFKQVLEIDEKLEVFPFAQNVLMGRR